MMVWRNYVFFLFACPLETHGGSSSLDSKLCTEKADEGRNDNVIWCLASGEAIVSVTPSSWTNLYNKIKSHESSNCLNSKRSFTISWRPYAVLNFLIRRPPPLFARTYETEQMKWKHFFPWCPSPSVPALTRGCATADSSAFLELEAHGLQLGKATVAAFRFRTTFLAAEWIFSTASSLISTSSVSLDRLVAALKFLWILLCQPSFPVRTLTSYDKW